MTEPGATEYAALLDAMNYDLAECRDDSRFISDWADVEPLARICDRCPLFDACERYARTAKPKGGVWAGRRWSNTKGSK